jgi:hypothetical protein
LFQAVANEKGGPEAAFHFGLLYFCRLARLAPLAKIDQEPAPESVVTARRFCDQQEMSSQTATGRSLP